MRSNDIVYGIIFFQKIRSAYGWEQLDAFYWHRPMASRCSQHFQENILVFWLLGIKWLYSFPLRHFPVENRLYYMYMYMSFSPDNRFKEEFYLRKSCYTVDLVCGGKFTIRWIPTSSADRLGDAISSRMTFRLLLQVLLLLSCMLFLIFLVVRAASTPIALYILCSRPSLEKAKRPILYLCSLYLRLFLFCASSQISYPWHDQLYCDQRL